MHPVTALIELQEADLEIVRAEKRLDTLPEKQAILDVKHKAAEVAGLLEKAKQYCGEVDRAVTRGEDEIASLTEKMAAEQAKLTGGEITDHKMVANLSRELDALRRRKEKLEMETTALMEKAEKAAKQAATIEAAIGQLAAKEERLTEAFKKAGGEVLAEIARLKARRDALCKSVPAGTLASYERVRGSRHGIGVGVLKERTCGACGIEIPADRVHVLLDGPDVAECPMCRRLIVVRVPESGA
ncbi:MAG: hypothetical protein FDZ70_02880 [Actinobacteria bacterium]|nr:MAG: hypothetical protein FDZ70_02880 [Actinomycetota bacterium]